MNQKIYNDVMSGRSCMAHGETKEEALREIEIAKELWLETAREEGQPISEPALFSDMPVINNAKYLHE